MWKLWKFEVARGFDPQRLSEHVYLVPTLRREFSSILSNNYFVNIVATLASFFYKPDHFSILAMVMSANPLHSTMLMVKSPYHEPQAYRRVTNPPTLAFRTYRSIGIQC